MAMTIEEAVETLNKYRWRDRDDWILTDNEIHTQQVTFSGEWRIDLSGLRFDGVL
jgi:hypothetical protein